MYHILRFLEQQRLIDYIEKDDMIKTTKKLDQFMDWNLLNQNNYQRILRVIGTIEEPAKRGGKRRQNRSEKKETKL